MDLTKHVERIARAMAILGGLVLTALVLLTCVSVLGRGGNTLGHSTFLNAVAPSLAERLIATGIGPVNGDFELIEAGVAFSIFAFLPICQLLGGHATVDVFTAALPTRANRLIMTVWEIVLAAVIVLIAWRLYEGMTGKFKNSETALLLQFPIWWAYGASFAASVVAAIVAVYCAGARVAELALGRTFMPHAVGTVE